MSVEIIEQVTSFSEYMQGTSILPKAKNGYWTVSKTNAFDKIKYYDYHIEYKSLIDCDHNFRGKNKDFVSGLKQLGLDICFLRYRNNYYEKGSITIYMIL
ncbi:MAG: hypothetical protein J6K22_08780 [Spirochaetaceae bacterium]|nr:hypothetical protein [Spirochaetaceae bacterium]